MHRVYLDDRSPAREEPPLYTATPASSLRQENTTPSLTAHKGKPSWASTLSFGLFG